MVLSLDDQALRDQYRPARARHDGYAIGGAALVVIIGLLIALTVALT